MNPNTKQILGLDLSSYSGNITNEDLEKHLLRMFELKQIEDVKAIRRELIKVNRTKPFNDAMKVFVQNKLDDFLRFYNLNTCVGLIKTVEQKELIQELLDSDNEGLVNCKRWLENEKNHRNTKRYNDTLKRYLALLNKAKEMMLTAYTPDSSKENKDIHMQLFEELIDLALPEPYTKKEFIDRFIEINTRKLQNEGLSKSNAEAVSKEIFNYHFPEN